MHNLPASNARGFALFSVRVMSKLTESARFLMPKCSNSLDFRTDNGEDAVGERLGREERSHSPSFLLWRNNPL